MKTSLRPSSVLLALLLAATIAASAYAQSPAREQAFVYATTFFDGLTYSSAMTPPDVDTLYLIADRVNIVAPRRTMIYYWPITNRYLPDWSQLNEVVEGELEIYRGDELIAAIALDDYVIQYDSSDPLGSLRIGLGAEALEQRRAFDELFDAYRQALFDHYEAEQAYRAELDEIIANNEPGTVDPADLPVRPEPVPPFTLQSTEPNKAYPVELPVGRYTVLMRSSNGIPVPDSERSLVVFDSEQSGAAYSVVPQSRWTRPEDSVYPNSVIYAGPGATLYLSPSRESLFNELYYSRMMDPQDTTARADRSMWVLHDPYPDTTLRVTGQDGTIWEVALKAFFVQQLPGSGLGYEVLEFNPETMTQVSFEGFELRLEAENPTYQVELLDEDGQPIPGSRRELRILNTGRGSQVYILGLLPLVVGGVVLAARRRQIRAVEPRAAG